MKANEGWTRKDGGDIEDLAPWRFVRVTTYGLGDEKDETVTLDNPREITFLGHPALSGYLRNSRDGAKHIIHTERVTKIKEMRESKKYGGLVEVVATEETS